MNTLNNLSRPDMYVCLCVYAYTSEYVGDCVAVSFWYTQRSSMTDFVTGATGSVRSSDEWLGMANNNPYSKSDLHIQRLLNLSI